MKGARCFSSKCPIEKRGAVPPGVHGIKSGIRLSTYGKQLREKQKAKRRYGVSERQMKNYFKKAIKEKEATGELLLRLLETRLDNVVYRLGLAPSRATARQLVVHGHVLVNGKRLTVPSYQVEIGDQIGLTEKAAKMDKVQSWLAKKDLEIPSWLERKGLIGKIKDFPKREEMPQELDEHLIVEFYSR